MKAIFTPGMKHWRELDENQICADCQKESEFFFFFFFFYSSSTYHTFIDPTFLSLNFGVFLCARCAGIHMNFSLTKTSKGIPFLSKIRPLDFYEFPLHEIEVNIFFDFFFFLLLLLQLNLSSFNKGHKSSWK